MRKISKKLDDSTESFKDISSDIELERESKQLDESLSNFRPKAYAISYYLILNNSLKKFFEDHNSEFILDDGIYTYAGKNTISYFQKIFFKYVFEEIFRIVDEIDKNHSEQRIKKYYIIDSCIPAFNALASLDMSRNIAYASLPDEALLIKYFLLEKDLSIDMLNLQDAWENIFNKLFKAKKQQHNIFFLRHTNLDFDQLRNILGLIFGNNNVIDYSDDQLKDSILCLGDLNEKLTLSTDRIMMASKELNRIVEDVKQYINQSLQG